MKFLKEKLLRSSVKKILKESSNGKFQRKIAVSESDVSDSSDAPNVTLGFSFGTFLLKFPQGF